VREPLPVDEVVERVRRRLGEALVPGLVSVYLFGSYARDAAHRESDVDVAVLLDRVTYPDTAARFGVRVRLASELGAAVGREADIVVLNDAPPLLGRRIVEEGRRLLCADADADRAFAIQVKIRAADVLPWYRRYARIKLDAIRR
jgi:predicted nucleotidyltransferase